LQLAQNEVHQAAHDQDLIEVPKRAKRERENDGQRLDLPTVEQTDQTER
jgi:hypothetical protein